MTSLQEEITKHIKIPPQKLKSDEELLEILKRRLTKKELKSLHALSNNEDSSVVCKRLNLSTQRYSELCQNLTKKLNQEKLKYELSNFC